MQTAFASRVVKYDTGSFTSLLPGYPRRPYTRAFNEFFNEFLRIFLISENSLKFAIFFCWGNEFSIYGQRYTEIGGALSCQPMLAFLL